jgi:hypothetical protein
VQVKQFYTLRVAWQVNINTLLYRLLQLEELEDGYILHQQLREGTSCSHKLSLSYAHYAEKYSLNRTTERFYPPTRENESRKSVKDLTATNG